MERPPRWTPLKEYPMRWKMRSSLASLFLPISLSLLSTSLSPPVSRESQFRPPSCTSFRSFLGPFQGSPKAKVAKKGKEERKKWRERGRGRAFQRVFRMKSRPNEVRKLPNGEASSLLLVGSKWRGKKCRLAVAFVATGE